jgi:alpha-L-rhamnosidase
LCSSPVYDVWFSVSFSHKDGPTQGQWVFDFGQNLAGYTTIKLPKGLCAQAGQLQIRQQYAEALHHEKGPVFHHFPNSKEVATLFCSAASPGDDEGLEYTVHFSQMGFRYVQLSLSAVHNSSISAFVPSKDMLTARFISTSFVHHAQFACSDQVITGSQHMILASARSNWMSIPTDCPTRERAGWLGDAHIAAETILRNFDAYGGYRLFLRQIDESLNAEGCPPDVVPFLGGHGGGGTPTWAAAFPFLADWLVLYYDDAQVMTEFYQGVQRYMEYQINHTKDGKCFGAPDWGDWCPPAPTANSSANCAGGSKQVSCFHYLLGLRIIARWADELGKQTDSQRYHGLVTSVEVDFKSGFKPGVGYGSQTFNSLGMELGLHGGSEQALLVNATAYDVQVVELYSTTHCTLHSLYA